MRQGLRQFGDEPDQLTGNLASLVGRQGAHHGVFAVGDSEADSMAELDHLDFIAGRGAGQPGKEPSTLT